MDISGKDFLKKGNQKKADSEQWFQTENELVWAGINKSGYLIY